MLFFRTAKLLEAAAALLPFYLTKHIFLAYRLVVIKRRTLIQFTIKNRTWQAVAVS